MKWYKKLAKKNIQNRILFYWLLNLLSLFLESTENFIFGRIYYHRSI